MKKPKHEKGKEPWATENRVLPVELTEEEIRQHGKDLAQRMVQIIQTEEELAAHSADVRGRLKEATAGVRRLARIISSGTDQRSVACSVYRRLEDRMHVVVRNDTDEVVFERGLTEEEELALRQQALPGVEAIQ